MSSVRHCDLSCYPKCCFCLWQPVAFYIKCFLFWGLSSEQQSSQWADAHPTTVIPGSWIFDNVGGLWGRRKPRTRRGFRGIAYLRNYHDWLWIFWDLFKTWINRCQYHFIHEENSLNVLEIPAVSNYLPTCPARLLAALIAQWQFTMQHLQPTDIWKQRKVACAEYQIKRYRTEYVIVVLEGDSSKLF